MDAPDRMTIATDATDASVRLPRRGPRATSGPSAAIDRLIAAMEERGELRPLLDALLLKARHDLGLPLVQAGAPGRPRPSRHRTQYEDRYVEAIRHVGGRLLERGRHRRRLALLPRHRRERAGRRAPSTPSSRARGTTSVGHVVEVAFNQGAHPRRGFELILDHFGVCSAITRVRAAPSRRGDPRGLRRGA